MHIHKVDTERSAHLVGIKALKAFIKPFETPQRSVKIKIYLLKKLCELTQYVPKNVTIFTGKQLKFCNFLKKRLHRKCFPLKFVKFLRTPFFTEHHRWLCQNQWSAC